MSSIRSTSLFAILTALAFVGLPKSQAASGTWAGATSGNWDLDSNWVGSIEGEGAGFTANIPYNVSVTLAGVSETIGIVNLGLTTGNSAILATGGATLTMDNNGSQAQINAGPTQAVIPISVPLLMTAGGLKITTKGASLGVSGAISSIAGSGTQTLTLSHNGGGNQFLVSSPISDGNSGGVVGVVVDSTTGPTVLTGTNFFTGGVVLRNSSLTASVAAMAGNVLTIGDGGTTINTTFSPGSSGTYTGDIIVGLGAGTRQISVGALSVNFSGSVSLGQNLIVLPQNLGVAAFSGNVSGTGGFTTTANNGGLGTITISGSNTFLGGVNISNGAGTRLNIGSASALGSGTLTFGNSTNRRDMEFDNTSNAPLTLSTTNAIVLASNASFIGSNDLNMGTGGVTIAATTTAVLNVLAKKLTLGGVITGAKSVGVMGSGTVALTGANSYSSTTFVGGNLAVSSLANGGTNSNIGASTNVAGNLVLNRGTLQYSGSAVTTDRLFTVGNGGGAIDSSGSGALVFGNTGTNISTDTVALTFTTATFVVGSSTITVNPTTSGNTTVNLAVGQTVSGASIAANTVITQILDGSRIVISNATTGTSTASSYTFGALDRTFTLTGTNSGNNKVSGVLANSASKTLSVTKSGSGSWILSGTNTYTGVTTISAGTLVLSTAGTNNIAGSTTINVQSGANLDVTAVAGGFTLVSGQTLVGTGTLVGGLTVANNSTISPGNSPGALHTGNETWLDGGNYNWQIYDATGLAGTGYDAIAIAGALDLTNLTGGTDFNINLWSLSGIAPDANGNAINFNNALSQSWTLVSTTGGITGFLASEFTINVGAANGTNGFTNTLGGGAFSVGVSGNDLLLSYTAVPEPGTAAMLLTGVGMFFLLKRRRFRS